MSNPPVLSPLERDPADLAPAESYRHADPVWVYRDGTWCAGVVEVASTSAVTVRYRSASRRGTCVDTLAATHVQTRTGSDPLLDGDELDRMADAAR